LLELPSIYLEMMRYFFCLCSFIFLTCQSLTAQTPLQPNDLLEEHDLMPYDLAYLVDSTNTLTFSEITSNQYESRFQQHTSYQNRDFEKNASYWIRLPVKHSVSTQKIWLIEFYDQTIDHLDVYIPQENGSYLTKTMGDNLPFQQRMYRHKNFEIMLNMKSDTTMYYYFKIKSHEFADLRIAFRSVNWFIYYALNEYFLFGTFYGMILIIALYNFLIYLAIREVKNIFYICYILSVAAYAMGLDGIGFQYLWPDSPELNDYAIGVALYSLIFWALIFTRIFLSTETNAPALDKILKWVIVIRTVLFIVELVFYQQLLTYRNLEIIPLSLIFYTGIKVWRDGFRPARFFVIAYGVLFAGFFLRILVYINVFPFTTLTHYSLHISFVVEMLLLTFALGDRVRILKDMRDHALRRIIHEHEVNMQLKEQVNRELEEKVKERTSALNSKNLELQTINARIEKQSKEINQINSILDLDNWKLKNRIIEVLEERLHEKTMDYHEFQTLYPDTLACYRFLEGLKWEKGFQCRKCKNEKSFAGAQKFSKRCTRCGYNESITAFTVFHGIKFPIEKAFYIAYLTVTAKKSITLDAMAQQLDIGLNTVWAFRTKIQQHLVRLEESGKRPTASNWEEIIQAHPTKKSTKRSSLSMP
jgi:hypothetical protein